MPATLSLPWIGPRQLAFPSKAASSPDTPSLYYRYRYWEPRWEVTTALWKCSTYCRMSIALNQ